MIRRILARHWYPLALAGLTAAVLLAAAFIFAVILPDTQRAAATADGSVPSPGSSVAPSGVPEGMSWLAMPPDAECSACHVTAEGTIGLRPVPPIAHPLDGWGDCTACHAPERLVATAPGHTGIHAEACLTCHQEGTLPAPLSRPHRERQNTACLDCHGSVAPLPSDMAHRTDTVCWLCHRLPEEQPPVPRHAVRSGQTDCLTCHVAGSVGALPADHAKRTPSECLLCHAPPSAGVRISRSLAMAP
jgi:hypothetical protein